MPYADYVGIPHRRGYLLYGVPGSGKTSLGKCYSDQISLLTMVAVSAIASELGLNIYIVSLGQSRCVVPNNAHVPC